MPVFGASPLQRMGDLRHPSVRCQELMANCLAAMDIQEHQLSDEGSTSFASVGQVSSGSRSESNNSKDDRSGSYTFDGYNLTLEYDNGQVLQMLTFALDEDYKELWFKGGYLKRLE